MKYKNLGHTQIKVSILCLGTMTWGQQNTQKEAHEQLDYAFERGINFIDTAEMYPIPPEKKTYSLTESFIGRWDKMKHNRGDIVVATKIAGPGMTHIRGGGPTPFSKKNIREAVDASLSRLNTDYIDLYQLHWPERSINSFGPLGDGHIPGESTTSLEDTLETFQEIQETGKVREFGLSNETPWGVMKFLEVAEDCGYPRIVSVQNPYNFLNRTYENGLSEISIRENCGLLAYSPLGHGVLTGKYLEKPEGARLTLWPSYTRYTGVTARRATERYVALAHKHGHPASQMSLSFVCSRKFVTSCLIGATNLSQLKENIGAADLSLSDTLEEEIECIHRDISNPAP